ncbi:hypothetical protein [Streptomyces jumonjinensis]|uniref:Restriction endonuclease type IV Mrr domain-containing protein n=1 Tax=Streptomyces jumonjinensis TaxID=1945 RepID=A0A646KKA8_STRJU|nr:hypothetical protein [Streptomyces jumonjinensis]MQT02663.1 hypothetical protein [Streptomyces jumonjinensis]
MTDGVPVRCPSCLRDHLFVSPVYPCPCGAPLSPPLLHGVEPERVVSRTWDEDWVRVRCLECGRRDHWPQPELGCPCGTLLRLPVRPADARHGPDGPNHEGFRGTGGSWGVEPADPADAPAALPPSGWTGIAPTDWTTGIPPAEWTGTSPDSPPAGPPLQPPPSHIPLPRTAGAPRPSFRPVAIRTVRDAVAVAELYLRWLGFPDVVQQVSPPPGARPEDLRHSGNASAAVDLRGPGLIAQVDPSTRPATLRDVECLWLNGLASSASTVFFSLAGYADDARSRADDLGVPLFAMDLTGSPQPVNGPAAELVSTGA